ncbi:pantetheine-phosphate adenylyltransferase [Candidatus Pacearchaeota archaeon]|nr:pantetheine-phosphate adenylyltransferase [Candidatus Pacearchaeota archaeon]
MVKALYAFSGDPITYGHMDIINRAAKSFDEIIVGIGANPEKEYIFTLEERRDIAQKSLADIPNVKVVSFSGLLVDFAYENGIPVIVKGVRDSKDFEYEASLHNAGETQKLGIETFILFARPELAHISSSTVKAIQKEQGLIHEFVPLYVKQCLEAKMSEQYIVGVTGEICAGKSYICKKFEELGKEKGVQVANIELDEIGHQILGDLKEPRYEEVRETIAKIFGEKVRQENGMINRKALGEIVFDDFQQLKKLNEIMYTPLLVRLRRELYGKKGLILFNAALIAESDMGYLCNNNVILINVDKKSQERRMRGRALTEQQIKTRLASQYNFDEKFKMLDKAIKRDNQGKIWLLNNSDNSDSSSIENTFDDVVRELKVK